MALQIPIEAKQLEHRASTHNTLRHNTFKAPIDPYSISTIQGSISDKSPERLQPFAIPPTKTQSQRHLSASRKIPSKALRPKASHPHMFVTMKRIHPGAYPHRPYPAHHTGCSAVIGTTWLNRVIGLRHLFPSTGFKERKVHQQDMQAF